MGGVRFMQAGAGMKEWGIQAWSSAGGHPAGGARCELCAPRCSKRATPPCDKADAGRARVHGGHPECGEGGWGVQMGVPCMMHSVMGPA